MKSVFIIGSCVSRDAFGKNTTGSFVVETYVARTSLASALETRPYLGVDLENIQSPFQRRMVEIDVNKGLSALLHGTKADIILIDPIDERFDIFEKSDGTMVTLSSELRYSGYQCPVDSGTLIPSGSEGFFLRWESGWNRLIAQLQQQGMLDRVRVNRIYWSTQHEDGTGYLPDYPLSHILSANRFLMRLYGRMEADLARGQFIDYPPALLVGSASHQWGLSPFHYVPAVYSTLIENLMRHAPMENTHTGNAVVNGCEHLLELGRFELDSTMRWFSIDAPEGATLWFAAEVECPPGITERRALVSFDCDSEEGNASMPANGFMKSHDPAVGYFRYLTTRPGKARTAFSIALPNGVKTFRLGLRSWWPESEVSMEWLRLSIARKKNLPL